MITYAEDLYVSDSLRDRVQTIRRALQKGEAVRDVYVLYRGGQSPSGGSGRLEAMRGSYFGQAYVQAQDYRVVGLTADYDEALLYMAADYCQGQSQA